MIANRELPQSFWAKNKLIIYLVVFGLFILGLGLRMIDFTDPPLDSGYRQVHALIIARGMYYQMLPGADPNLRQVAISLWHNEDIFEPPIFERLVAFTYLLTGGEHIWIPRAFSILFWLIGGLALFQLARKMTSVDGAIVSLAFYLVLPFGVILSRRFQPESFMVMWILLAALALWNWEEKRDLKSAIWVGLSCAMAVVVKVFAVFFIAPMAVALVLYSGNLKQSIRKPQIWLMAGIMVIIPALVYLVIRPGSEGYFLFWSYSLRGLLTQPSFYVRWWELLNTLFNGIVVIIALAGIIVAQPKARALLLALWLGYLLFGLFEPWQINTHDYYSLILVPIIAISLAPVASIFFSFLAQQPRLWKSLFICLALFALAIPSWYARVELVRTDSRINWMAWTRLGKQIPRDGNMISLSNDYGTYAEYFGWRTVKLWPTIQDMSLTEARGSNLESNFQQLFAQQTQGMDYFLIVAFSELDNQPQLKTFLYDHYTYTEGDGFLLFNLRSPVENP